MGFCRQASLALGAVAALLPGCSLRLDFDQVARGHAPLDGGPEAAVSAPAAATSDAHAVPSAGDGGLAPSPDSAVTAFDHPFFSQAELPDPTGFACATQTALATFCDDFETSALKDHWTNPIQIPGTTTHLSIDTTLARAGHGALLAQLDTSAIADNYLGAYALELFQSFEGMPVRATIDFDLRVELIDPVQDRYVALFEFNFGDILGDHNELFVRLQSDQTSVRAHLVERDVTKPNNPLPPDVEQLFSYALSPTPNLNEWTHLRFELDAVNPTGSGNMVRVTLGSELLYEGPLHFALRGLQPRIGVGLPWPSTLMFSADNPSRGWRVRYDNVLVRIAAR